MANNFVIKQEQKMTFDGKDFIIQRIDVPAVRLVDLNYTPGCILTFHDQDVDLGNLDEDQLRKYTRDLAGRAGEEARLRSAHLPGEIDQTSRSGNHT